MVLHKNKWDKRATRNYYRKHGITPPGVEEKRQEEEERQVQSRDAWKQEQGESDNSSNSDESERDENSKQDNNDDETETKVNRPRKGLGNNAWRYQEEEQNAGSFLVQEPEIPLDYSKLASKSILADQDDDDNRKVTKVKGEEKQEFTSLAAKIEQQKRINAYRERYKHKPPGISRPTTGKIARPKKIPMGDSQEFDYISSDTDNYSDNDYKHARQERANDNEQDIDEFLASLDQQNKVESSEDGDDEGQRISNELDHHLNLHDTKCDQETLDQLLSS